MEVKHLVFRIQWRSGRVTGESSCLSGIQSELVFWCSQPELLVSNEESLMYLVKGGEGPAGWMKDTPPDRSKPRPHPRLPGCCLVLFTLLWINLECIQTSGSASTLSTSE